jgi:hypothetical protein
MGKWLKRDLKRRKRINVERKKKRKRPQSKKRNERERERRVWPNACYSLGFTLAFVPRESIRFPTLTLHPRNTTLKRKKEKETK